MARRLYDPLAFVPSPDVIREKLTETLSLAERLRLLLDLAERLSPTLTTGDTLPPSRNSANSTRRVTG
jgi:hypothetical protein